MRKTKRVRLTPGVPRDVLKSNSQIGLQDQREQDARTSCDQPSGSNTSWKTGSNTVYYRIPGIPLSVDEQQDTNRNDKVKKLIEKFENHPNKESFQQDFKQTKEINKFSEKSQELIADMNNTEIFELCETSSKQQCPDCNLYWEVGIVCCICGRLMKFRPVVDNDTTVHATHAHTVAFSPPVLMKCSICPYHQTLTRAP